jgi:hypothetical protein
MAAQLNTVVPKILVLHGDADPVVPLESDYISGGNAACSSELADQHIQ